MKNMNLSIALYSLYFSFYGCQAMTGDIVIKSADKNDLLATVELTRTIFFEDFKPILQKGYSDNPIVKAGHVDQVLNAWLKVRDDNYEECVSDTTETHQLIIAQDTEKTHNNVIGLCSFEKQILENQKKRVYITFLAVSKEMRRRGLGTILLRQAIEKFDDVEACELTTLDKCNEAVQKFYENLGFVNQGIVTIDPRAQGSHRLYRIEINNQ